MSDSVYHINPETGRPNRCYAQVKCRYGADSPHYASKEEARDAYENEHKEIAIPPGLKRAAEQMPTKETAEAMLTPEMIEHYNNSERGKREKELLDANIPYELIEIYENASDKEAAAAVISPQAVKDYNAAQARKAAKEAELEAYIKHKEASESRGDDPEDYMFDDTDDDYRNTYYFSKDDLPQALEKVEKANAKLEKYGIEERFQYEIEEKTRKEGYLPGTFIEMQSTIVRFKVLTPTISKNGYKFLARVDAAEAGLVVRSSEDVELDGWRPESQYCEHCSSNRERNTTYLVEDSEGKRMQVGSSCIKAYTGVSISGLWSVGIDLDLQDDEMQRDSTRVRGGDNRMPTKDIIAYALAVSNDGENFVSKSTSMNYGMPSTVDDLNFVLHADPKDPAMRRQQELMTAKAKENIENGKAEEVLEYIRSIKAENDYTSNLSIISKGENVTSKDLGILVSGLSAFRRKKKAEEKAARPKAAKGYAGEVGSKLKGMKATVSNITHREVYDEYANGYVMKSIVKFRDEENHEMVWFASKEIKDINPGQKITFTGGSVKSHGSFNDEDQTNLTRVKVTPDEDS